MRGRRLTDGRPRTAWMFSPHCNHPRTIRNDLLYTCQSPNCDLRLVQLRQVEMAVPGPLNAVHFSVSFQHCNVLQDFFACTHGTLHRRRVIDSRSASGQIFLDLAVTVSFPMCRAPPEDL